MFRRWHRRLLSHARHLVMSTWIHVSSARASFDRAPLRRSGGRKAGTRPWPGGAVAARRRRARPIPCSCPASLNAHGNSQHVRCRFDDRGAAGDDGRGSATVTIGDSHNAGAAARRHIISWALVGAGERVPDRPWCAGLPYVGVSTRRQVAMPRFLHVARWPSFSDGQSH
jgi:hypothetical protein